jgi:glutamate formiminotransferase/glutamate formiminotransferase/formiminotetrahydrofolate cyclodeaminase
LAPSHPTAGRCAVGARPVLVAYNVWLAPPATIDDARRIAAAVRGPHVRALGFDVGGQPQVSCNLIEPAAVGPGALVDAVASRAGIARTELVGLVPASVLHAEPPSRWPALDLDPSRTIEARLERAGLDGGSR